jgi:hypothetical protein
MVIKLEEFKQLMRDLSILTGKTPTVYGKAPNTPEKLDYMIEVYHRELKRYDREFILKAFQDKGLRQEMSVSFSLNVNIIEKYVLIHKNNKPSKRSMNEDQAFRSKVPKDCVKALEKLGINISKIAEGKII